MSEEVIRELISEYLNVSISKDGNKFHNFYNVSEKGLIDAIKAAYQVGFDDGFIDGVEDEPVSE